MTPEQVLDLPPLRLSQSQRQSYFAKGFLTAEGLVPAPWLRRLRAATADLVAESRGADGADARFDLAPEHHPEDPRPRRIRAAVDQHPDYWAFAGAPEITDIVADLVGPDVKFHSSKLNFKWPGGDEEVKWHQDIPAWPHTNYSPVTVGVYLEDVDGAEGPLAAIPGSHDGELFDHFCDNGNWAGHVAERDLARVALDTAEEMAGPAGTLIFINCRTIHGSQRNRSNRVRPLLLNVYSAADAFAFGAPPTPTSHTGEIVRGEPSHWSHNDPRPCRIPPDWAMQGYVSIYAAQKQEGLVPSVTIPGRVGRRSETAG